MTRQSAQQSLYHIPHFVAAICFKLLDYQLSAQLKTLLVLELSKQLQQSWHLQFVWNETQKQILEADITSA